MSTDAAVVFMHSMILIRSLQTNHFRSQLTESSTELRNEQIVSGSDSVRSNKRFVLLHESLTNDMYCASSG